MGAQALQRAVRIGENVQGLRECIACTQRAGNHHTESEMLALLEELEAWHARNQGWRSFTARYSSQMSQITIRSKALRAISPMPPVRVKR
jgi:hypothetical protein